MLMQLLDVLQIADSSFPSGSYAHSWGLETLYAFGEVALDAHLRFLLKNGLARVELPVIRMASRSIGRSFLRAASRIRPVETEVEHHAVVFGIVLRNWGLDLQDGLHMYAFQAARQQLSAAQRLGKIGQTEMQ